jgi:hypothetical protein
MPFLSLRFARRKDPARSRKAHMPDLDSGQLLRACAGLPCSGNQDLKRRAADLLQDFRIFVDGNNLLAALGSWLVNEFHRVSVNEADSMRPTIGPLNPTNAIALIGQRPMGVLGHPAEYVDRLQPQRRAVNLQKRRERFNELAVPVIGSRRALSFRPFQEIIEQLEDGNTGIRRVAIAAVEHELVKAVVGGLAVGAEIKTATVNRNEPGVSVLAEPGLRITRHCRKPSS